MRIFQTFTEGGYHFTCIVLQGEDGAFSCAIEFTPLENATGKNVGSVEMRAYFASAVVALRAAEHYGRQLICQHSDLPQYLATKMDLEE